MQNKPAGAIQRDRDSCDFPVFALVVRDGFRDGTLASEFFPEGLERDNCATVAQTEGEQIRRKNQIRIKEPWGPVVDIQFRGNDAIFAEKEGIDDLCFLLQAVNTQHL